MENLTTGCAFVVSPEQRVGGTDYLSEAKLILLEGERRCEPHGPPLRVEISGDIRIHLIRLSQLFNLDEESSKKLPGVSGE
jgi:hypothetical protein